MPTEIVSANVRYRGYCKTQSRYCGPSRTDRAAARQDCRDHIREPGQENHRTVVMMEQKTKIELEDVE